MNLRSSIYQLFKRYYIAIGVIIFLFGIILRLISIIFPTTITTLLGELGTFLAVAVAIPFIYDLFLREKDREIFLNDLSAHVSIHLFMSSLQLEILSPTSFIVLSSTSL